VSLARLIFHPYVCRNPVHFPSLAAVVRGRPVRNARIRSDVRDDKPNIDGSALNVSWSKKLAAAIFEVANRGWLRVPSLLFEKLDSTDGIADCIDAGSDLRNDLRGHRPQAPTNCPAIPNRADDGRAVIFDPGSRAS